MTLVERAVIGASQVTSLNFARYPIPRMADPPRVEIAILDRREVPPAGCGETALIVGAIANALRAAAGRRFTRLRTPSG